MQLLFLFFSPIGLEPPYEYAVRIYTDYYPTSMRVYEKNNNNNNNNNNTNSNNNNNLHNDDNNK